MGGLNLLLNVAKDALITQQYAIDVISHNVANVNNEGYSRQTPTLEAKNPAPYAGYVFGRGVELGSIERSVDTFVETRLRDRNSDLLGLNEKEVYLGALEGIFNENSDHSLSTQFADFWNAWHDLSNNPSGLAERDTVREMGALLSQSFEDLAGDMAQFEREIDLSLSTGIRTINELAGEIAGLNEQILTQEALGAANDLRDQRDAVLIELSRYLDINAFESEDGSVTVMTDGGYSLVENFSSYELAMEWNATTLRNDVTWEGSGGANIAITDTIKAGKMGGWLDIRDEILPKYEADLDELAKATIWAVNTVHSQGVGTAYFQTAITGTYQTDDTLGGLSFGGTDYVDYSTGSFTLWIDEGTGPQAVLLDLSSEGLDTTSSLSALESAINDRIDDEGLSGTVSAVAADGTLSFNPASGVSFAFSNDTSNLLAALGINTFFQGSDAYGMGTNSLLEDSPEYLAAARIDEADGDFAAGDNSNALAVTDLQYTDIEMDRWTYERGESASSQGVSETLENYLHALVGAIGIESQSISRQKEYGEVIAEELSATRDSISAVSLDEEMTSLIKYQQGYAAAAKLITAADEMFDTLLAVR